MDVKDMTEVVGMEPSTMEQDMKKGIKKGMSGIGKETGHVLGIAEAVDVVDMGVEKLDIEWWWRWDIGVEVVKVLNLKDWNKV